jgi:hypothetical protein
VDATPDPKLDARTAAQPRRSIVDTWTEVIADAGGLVRTEAALARAETAANLKSIGRQSAKLGAGAVLLSMALVFLTVAAVVAIAHLTGLLPALLIVAVLCVATGLLLLRSGQSRLSGQNLLPERTLGRMARDLDQLASRAAPPVPSDMPADLTGKAVQDAV